ncbi:MAG TPA: queuosine salvage family protein [Acidimicrobiia bacterium]|nr:queuosine salvage family protein [Acidimicrobiia bacterium]
MSGPTVDLAGSAPPPDWGVGIDDAALARLATRLADHHFAPASYEYEGTPDFTGEDWGRFVVLGVSVVWRLWPPAGQAMWAVRADGRRVEDAPGIWTCFARAPHSIDLEWIAEGGLGGDFFAGEGSLQDVPRRVARLRAVAEALVEHHRGSVIGMIEQAGGEALVLRDLVADTIPGYLDRPSSPAGTLPFDKLANLAVTMLAARLPVHGTDRFPVFPDYMLPRHLRHAGVLVYSSDLAAVVDGGRLLEPDSTEEMAIRWATIRSAEMLRLALGDLGNPVATPDLDYWLWSEAVLGPRAAAMGPHHLCMTEAY